MLASASIADTIIAQSSAPGHALRALLRLSGPDAAGVLGALGVQVPASRGVARCELLVRAGSHDEHAVCEPALCVPALLLWMPGSSTFTGQPTAEILLAAHAPLVQRVLQACCVGGARLAHAGEFSARAFAAGRLSLQQAEGLAATIAALNTQQLEAARSLLRGSVPYQSWYEETLTLLALVEAGIDFTDQEDVVAIAPAQLAMRAAGVLRAIHDCLGAAQGISLPRAVPVVTLVGAPNAGKSTLFNALLRRPRAVASAVAHTTRDVLREELDLWTWSPGAGTIALQDCPGLEAAREQEPLPEAHAHAQARARDALRDTDCVLWCDPSGEFDEARLLAMLGDASLAQLVRARGLRVRTCSDRPQPLAGERDCVAVSAVAGTGLHELARTLARSLHAGVQAGLGAVLPRHRVALTLAAQHLESVRSAAADSARFLHASELVAADLRAAASALGTLVGGSGTINPDEVLGRIFATFCVGK
jgi:tRNA modification GTPase